jgi:hypothetical protein
MPGTPPPLEIRCTGQRVNHISFKPVGPICGTLFESPAPYRNCRDWIERARVAGWRVSTVQPDNTVDAYCPNCLRPPRKQATPR